MKLIVIIALVVYLSLNLSKAQADDEWEQWKKKNHKEYPNARGLEAEAESENDIREEIFKENLEKIKDFNKKNSTFKMGLNEFSDLSIDELKKRFNVNIDIKNVIENIKHANKSDTNKARIISDTVNWATSGYMSPIQNQGDCGSCYTFSAVFLF